MDYSISWIYLKVILFKEWCDKFYTFVVECINQCHTAKIMRNKFYEKRLRGNLWN